MLYERKKSGAFERLKRFLEHDGVIFDGGVGAIIFGQSLESCALDDKNNVGLRDISGFDVLSGVSRLCHYTNHIGEKDRENTVYLTEPSKRLTGIAPPVEDTLFVNGDEVEVIGTRPFYCFANGVRGKREVK